MLVVRHIGEHHKI